MNNDNHNTNNKKTITVKKSRNLINTGTSIRDC